MNDEYFLKQTLTLAQRGKNWTFPNPLVGAVIVKNGAIIEKGYHRKLGLPHAEIEAISLAKSDLARLRGATLYVNLEPCVHYGKTPPCVDAIIQSGIRRVVCSTLDPNPKVYGRGVTMLRKAGIDVAVGMLEKEARTLNEAFFTFHEKNRPFVALKFAASLDGKIATRTGDSKWITNEKARAFARKLRGHYQAILVGINTIIKDNPHLGVRDKRFKDPLRIILDPTLRIPLTSTVLRDKNVLIVTTSFVNEKKLAALKEKGITIIQFSHRPRRLHARNLRGRFDRFDMPIASLLEELRKLEIISILVEGGGKTAGGFVYARLVDKVYAFHAPIIIGGKEAVSAVEGQGVEKLTQALRLKNVTFRRFHDNLLTIGYV